MENLPQIIIVTLFLGLWLFVFVKSTIRYVRNRHAPVRAVKAQVVDKFRTETFTKYHGSGKNESCRIVFEAEGKKLSFAVSEFSYDSYRVKATGMLKYRGDQLIDFS